MARYFSPDEIDKSFLLDATVAIMGYGNQGHAHALNLRDSRAQIVVGAREGRGAQEATGQGFEVLPFAEATKQADLIVLTLPDLAMAGIYMEHIEPNLKPDQALLFAHGFNIAYGLIRPTKGVDVILVAPKGAGAKLRQEYTEGRGLAALIAIEQDATGQAQERALAYAWGLGCARSVLLETTFKEETETDLFGEQAVLCGGIPELIKAAFEELVENGYQPEVAYFECLHEAKLITDLIYSRGIAGMRDAISDTALWGGLVAGPQVVGPESREAMSGILERIRDGSFARDWINEDASGRLRLKALVEKERAHPSETAGREVRQGMGLGPDP